MARISRATVMLSHPVNKAGRARGTGGVDFAGSRGEERWRKEKRGRDASGERGWSRFFLLLLFFSLYVIVGQCFIFLGSHTKYYHIYTLFFTSFCSYSFCLKTEIFNKIIILFYIYSIPDSLKYKHFSNYFNTNHRNQNTGKTIIKIHIKNKTIFKKADKRFKNLIRLSRQVS